uniref:Photosystem I reaction center subunit PsaK n=1 Tax=Corallina officinalis TaxID=35170 RepID=A0A6M3W9U0_COROI|nr:photosystem I subunit X [Corallina officinalis]QJF58570.1 photosystem I subunit X [Corallina officinalis]QJF58769.1 photosystem I subunit X [Corallina officinalis]QJF58968.1 photosystem I subunit X [Corallina officinalis]
MIKSNLKFKTNQYVIKMNNTYMLLTLLPSTTSWSAQISIIMIISNLIAIIIGRYAIQVRGLGPSIPISGMAGFGLTELLATTSLGHVLGAGAILGLHGIGLIN